MTDDPETRSPLAELFREHAAGLAGAARAVLGSSRDVPEVVQEAFLKAWKALSSGASPRDPSAWIFVLTLNAARDRARREGRRPTALGLDEVDPMELTTERHEGRGGGGGTGGLERAEVLAAARRAIHELDPTQREVFLLRTSGELSFEAVAQALSIPVGTAKTRMRAALTRLRARLASYGPEGGVGADEEGTRNAGRTAALERGSEQRGSE